MIKQETHLPRNFKWNRNQNFSWWYLKFRYYVGLLSIEIKMLTPPSSRQPPELFSFYSRESLVQLRLTTFLTCKTNVIISVSPKKTSPKHRYDRNIAVGRVVGQSPKMGLFLPLPNGRNLWRISIGVDPSWEKNPPPSRSQKQTFRRAQRWSWIFQGSPLATDRKKEATARIGGTPIFFHFCWGCCCCCCCCCCRCCCCCWKIHGIFVGRTTHPQMESCLNVFLFAVTSFQITNSKSGSLPSSKLTWQWIVPIFSRQCIFKWSILCHVRLQEAKSCWEYSSHMSHKKNEVPYFPLNPGCWRKGSFYFCYNPHLTVYPLYTLNNQGPFFHCQCIFWKTKQLGIMVDSGYSLAWSPHHLNLVS